MQRIAKGLHGLLLAELRRLVLWLPVGVACGCAGYFALAQEPNLFWGVGVPLLCGLSGVGLVWRGWASLWGRIGGGACAAIAAGFMLAWCAAHHQPPMPELPRRSTEITGRVQALTESLTRTNAQPVTTLELAQARFETPLDSGMAPLPRTLRLKMPPQHNAALKPGATVWVRAMLMPPPFPAYPGGRDMLREAWFTGLAGYGRVLAPVEVLAEATPPHASMAQRLEHLREQLALRIYAVLPNTQGAIAATLLVGEAGHITPQVRQEFAAAGLAHLLAVAGLHLGLVMALFMAVTRFGLAAWAWAALRWPCKTVAACTALVGGVGYAALTGLHLPVMRSLVMAGLVVLGLAAGRRAISLRGLALAALLLLGLHPEYVLNVAFQMSFAAVMALAAGYEVCGPHLAAFRAQSGGYPLACAVRWVLGHGFALALTSLLAGVATLPIVMAHFGVVQPYFIVANLVAVPLMAVWVMPWGMCALALMPVHMEAMALVPMGWGIGLIGIMAHKVAVWPAAHVLVPAMPAWGLACVLLGLCWLCLWRQGWRVWGALPLALGVASPFLVAIPQVLISADGGMVGVVQGKTLFVGGRSRDGAWAQAAWQQAFALRTLTPFPQHSETPDGLISCGEDDAPGLCLVSLKGKAILLRMADPSDGMQRLPDTLCAGIDVVISTAPLRESCPTVPIRLDRFTAWRNGATALFISAGGITVETGRGMQGNRPWVLKPGGHGMPNLPLAQAE